MSDKENKNTPRIGNLLTASDCRREIAKIYKLGRRKDIETQDMTRFASVLQILINAIREGDFEARLELLEQELSSGTGTPARGNNGYSKQH